jgi:hypothetical protein
MTCDEMLLPDVRAWIRLHPDAFFEAYPPRQINSLYLDTPEAHCLEDCLLGAKERGKLRYRWYGTDDSAVRGCLELKRKWNQLGWKERCEIPVTLDLRAITWVGWREHLERHATGEMALWLSRIDRPTLLIRYLREYYESMDRRVRITVDSAQRFYEQVSYLAPNLAIRSPVKSTVVVEVKCDAGQHRRLSNVLSSLPLQVERNSKYVNGLLGSLDLWK